MTDEDGNTTAGPWDSVTINDDEELRANAVPGGDQPPVAAFRAGCEALTCTFTSTSTDDRGIARYEWSAGDGARAQGDHPVWKHTYGRPGRYSVGLRVLDTRGQLGVVLMAVTVTEP